MTTATLATDSVASLSPSRLPAWLPRLLAQAASGVLRQPAKWPFSSGLSRGHLPAAARLMRATLGDWDWTSGGASTTVEAPAGA